MTRSRVPEAKRLEVVQGKALGTEFVVRAIAGMDAFGRVLKAMTQVAIVELGQVNHRFKTPARADWYIYLRLV